MAEVIIYTKSYCPYCVRAKALLDGLNQAYTEIDVEHDTDLQEEMKKRAGRHTVPQIFINDEHIGGCDELHELHDAGELEPKLAK